MSTAANHGIFCKSHISGDSQHTTIFTFSFQVMDRSMVWKEMSSLGWDSFEFIPGIGQSDGGGGMGRGP